MSTPPAGTTKKRMFSRNDYLAPLPIPTGRKPSDVLNIIWRKNEAFLDVGNYSIGSAVMVMWPSLMVFVFMGFITPDPDADTGLRRYYHRRSFNICDSGPLPRSPLTHTLQPPTPRSLRPSRQRRILDRPLGNRDSRRHPAFISQSGRQSHDGPTGHRFRKPRPARHRKTTNIFHWASTVAVAPRQWRCGNACAVIWRSGQRRHRMPQRLIQGQPALLHRLHEG